MNQIVKVYDTAKIDKRLVGYIKTSDHDFDWIKQGRKKRRVPNEFFKKKIKNQLGKDWLPSFGWKPLSDYEVNEIALSYEKRAEFYFRQANRLKTLNEM